MKYSKNELAEKIVGKREVFENTIVITEPCELGYHCPVCKYEQIVKGDFDERLEWSEYNGFIWCSVCNKDYPSVLCQPDIDKAIETYLSCVQRAILLSQNKSTVKKTEPEKRIWQCEYCGRKFIKKTGHRCKGGYRRRHLKFKKTK